MSYHARASTQLHVCGRAHSNFGRAWTFKHSNPGSQHCSYSGNLVRVNFKGWTNGVLSPFTLHVFMINSYMLDNERGHKTKEMDILPHENMWLVFDSDLEGFQYCIAQPASPKSDCCWNSMTNRIVLFGLLTPLFYPFLLFCLFLTSSLRCPIAHCDSQNT
jgi:hypothetical protein